MTSTSPTLARLCLLASRNGLWVGTDKLPHSSCVEGCLLEKICILGHWHESTVASSFSRRLYFPGVAARYSLVAGWTRKVELKIRDNELDVVQKTKYL